MSRPMLIGLLALQILIVTGVLAWNLREPPKPEQFFDFDASAVTKLQIGMPEETVVVQKDNESWLLDDGKPADGEKVMRVLEKLADASTGWPVATSTATAERFEVTEDAYQKHLTLFAEDEVVADAYFGTSPSFRLVHVSSADGGPVYAIEFSNYELGNDKSAWLYKSLLRPEGEMTTLKHEGEYVLNKVEGSWVADSGVELDTEVVEKVAGRFENLSVYTISDAELPDEPTARLSWSDAAGEAELLLFHFEEEDDWVATSNRVKGQYGISTYIAEDMAMSLADLQPQSEEEAEESAEESSEILEALDTGLLDSHSHSHDH